MWERLTGRLQGIFARWTKKGRLTEADVQEGLRQIRLALLEADVHFRVVKDFLDHVRQRAVGQEVMQSLSPGQQLVKVVYEELRTLLGREEESQVRWALRPPTVWVLAGLQGSGKTTTAVKVAHYFRRTEQKRPLLVATDVRRPAAIRQLEVLGAQAQLPVFAVGEQVSPPHIVRAALEHARQRHYDLVVVDTGGRLHIDEAMMEELRQVREAAQPQETLLVLDAMTGQDAVNIARRFEEMVGVDGFILTKLDGDARGGAALSIRAVTGKPIKFLGVGERIPDLEPFHPDRMASRILGMGDVLSIIERAEATMDAEVLARMEERLRHEEFDLEDMLIQLEQMQRMGSLEQLLALMPGMGGMSVEVDHRRLRQMQAIIYSMTPEERRHPEILNGSRRRRIARGSGTSVQQVNELLRTYRQMKEMLKQMVRMEKKGRLPFVGRFA